MSVYRSLNLFILLVFMFAGWQLFSYEILNLQEEVKIQGVVRVVFLCGILLLYAFSIFRGSSMQNRRLFFWVAGILVVFEVLLVLTNESSPYEDDVFRYPSPYMHFTAKPGIEIDANPHMADTQHPIRINEYGMRVETDINAAAPGVLKVFVLGGSTVFNGTPLSSTIPGLLQERLGDGYRVYNFGGVSYVSGQELDLLMHRVLELDPDYVITYDGSNDIVQPYNYDPRPGYPYNFMVYEKGVQLFHQRPLGDIVTLLLRKSAVMSKLFRRPLNARLLSLDDLRKSSGYLSPEWEREIVSHYADNIKKFCTVAKGYGFKYAAFFQPMVHFKEPRTPSEESHLGGEDFQKYIHRQYARTKESYSELEDLDESQCLFHDMSLSLSGVGEELYWDYVHTNNRGNEILAETIYREFIKGFGLQ